MVHVTLCVVVCRANSAVVVSGAVELLVHACSSQDRGIRLAGKENLHKLVKVMNLPVHH